MNMGEASMTIQRAIDKVISGMHLEQEEARKVMAEIMEGSATPAQIGGFLTALRMKGETVEEVTGLAQIMRKLAQPVPVEGFELLDTCGTGGDGAGTINISTAAAIIAAAGGIHVAKHGNRAATSKSGSADVLEALGVNITLGGQQAAECLKRVGICFMFAQTYHQSMKHVAGPRRELGIRTVFNMLGPLANPAGAERQLLGVFDPSKTEIMAGVLQALGSKRAMVVASHDGLDEISISAPTKVTELKNGKIETVEITPDDLGLRAHSITEIAGGDAQTNAEIIRRIYNGERGAYRDVVLANAGACFYVSEKCSTLQQGIKIAADLIDSGKAMNKLQELIAYTGEVSHVS
jgi:anthranilate phosphoribosyltransferase